MDDSQYRAPRRQYAKNSSVLPAYVFNPNTSFLSLPGHAIIAATMTEPVGLRIWSEFTRLHDKKSKDLLRFGDLPVSTILHAGDGGTFACHVKERVKKGLWSLYRLGIDEDLGIVLAVCQDAKPIRWEFAGGIVIDTSVGAFIPGPTFAEINAMDDTEELTDAIDEALFVADEDEAVLETENGRKFAVFQLGGDGNYDVYKGIDGDKRVCTLAVVF